MWTSSLVPVFLNFLGFFSGVSWPAAPAEQEWDEGGLKQHPNISGQAGENRARLVRGLEALRKSSVQLVPIKNETLFFFPSFFPLFFLFIFSRGAGIPDPSEVRTQRGFPLAEGIIAAIKSSQEHEERVEKTPCSWSSDTEKKKPSAAA